MVYESETTMQYNTALLRQTLGQAPSMNHAIALATPLSAAPTLASEGPRIQRRQLLVVAAATSAGIVPKQAQAQSASMADETWTDAARSRQIPVLLRWPAGAPKGLIVYSHGLGGQRTGADVWGQAWAAAGFAVAHLQHVGSDIAVFRQGAQALRSAGNGEQLVARVANVQFVLDEAARRQASGAGRWPEVPMERIGMAGHSFGARTVQALAGQAYPDAPTTQLAKLADARIKAFIALSPALGQGVGMEQARSAARGMTRPMMVATGSEDGDVLGNGETPASRRAAYEVLPPGNKALLWLHGADHYSFAGNQARIRAVGLIRRAAGAPELEAAHHAIVAAATTAWWQAALLGQALPNPAGLAAQDRWERG